MSTLTSSTASRRFIPMAIPLLSFVLLSEIQSSRAVVTGDAELDLVATDNQGNLVPCDAVVAGGDFIEIFDCGDELFEVRFNALDGVGMDVGDGGRFTRIPRPDLHNWSNTTPKRATGPNEQSCLQCHFDGADAGDGAGPVVAHNQRDPLGAGSGVPFPKRVIQRSAPHLFGPAGLQLLAEEMTVDLHALRDDAVEQACRTGGDVSVELETKGVDFGAITVTCAGVVDASLLEGVDPDLVVKPFDWKGVERTVRTFSRDAFHQEMGMQAVELTGDGVDGDFDGVTDELSIADITAMAVYVAAQPRPTSLRELDDIRRYLLGLGTQGAAIAEEWHLPALSDIERSAIDRGEGVFVDIGCASCHRPTLSTHGVVFSEPSQVAAFRDDPLPAGQDPVARGLDPANPVTFDITKDQPDNLIEVVVSDSGSLRSERRKSRKGRRSRESRSSSKNDTKTMQIRLGSFEPYPSGGSVIRLFGDLKRHDVGPKLAENIDAPPCNCGASVFMTAELWGVGSTAPYLHDGRATTLTEAILEHGGEAGEEQAAFVGLHDADRADLLSFLENLVLYFPAEEEAE